MRRKHSASPEVKEQIHFGTLQTQAREVIAKQAKHSWTDTAEHDPGITMLDAMAYNVSDLAYRHVLPIEDLLTSSDEKLADEELWSFDEQLLTGQSTEKRYGAGCALSADGKVLAVVMGFKPIVSETTGPETIGSEIQIFERVDDKFIFRQRLPYIERIRKEGPGIYGYAIGISRDGNRIVIGVPHSGADAPSGEIRIFERKDSTWEQRFTLEPDTKQGVLLGSTLSLSADGKTVASAGWIGRGNVYIYRQDDPTHWQTPIQPPIHKDKDKDKNEDKEEYPAFGYAICLSPDAHWLAIASRKTIGGRTNAGAVHLYEFSEKDGKWVEGPVIPNPFVEADAFFGSSLHFDPSGKQLAIGAPGTSEGGTVYIYLYDQGQWQCESTLHALDVTTDGGFGYAVRFGTSNTLAIGAYKKKIAGKVNAHAARAYLYHFDEQKKWVKAKSLIGFTTPGPIVFDNQGYGLSIAISGDDQCVVIGSPQNAADAKTPAGMLYVVLQKVKKENLFPESFGPHQALTCSPITVEDYRRALLDLRHGRTNQFYFRNVQLKPIQGKDEDSNAYQYGYEPGARQFTFQPTGAGIEKKVLLGDYLLYVELNRDVDQNIAKLVLDQFLLEHRNLGEAIRFIQQQQPKSIFAPITATIEIEDSVDDIAPILAQIYTLTENYLRPPAIRARAEDLIAQGWDKASIYQGPKLTHGWITQLPPERDYSQQYTFQFTPLVKMWKEVPGVRTIVAFDAGQKDKPWELTVSAGQYALAFSQTPLADLANGQYVAVHKRGRKMTTTEESIRKALPVTDNIDEMPVTLPVGRYRDPQRYHPLSLRLPACYQLQKTDLDDKNKDDVSLIHLHQFLLAFEQQLANGCDQLARLPSLLSFVREEELSQDEETIVWGEQWPFDRTGIPNEAPSEIHGQYREALIDVNKKAASNTNKELEIIDYLLSYFGERRASRTISPPAKEDTWIHDFLTVQRSYLQNITDLTYHRAAIRIDQISAVQRRIAARLGWEPKLFASNELDLAHLPFYIVERRALLPKKPNAVYDNLQPVVDLKELEPATTGKGGLVLTAKGKKLALEPGQLIDFVIDGENGGIYPANCINVIDGVDVTFLFADNENLKNHQQDLLNAQAEDKLQWQNSQVWLYEMKNPLQIVEQGGAKNIVDAEEDTEVSKTLYARYFPTSIQVGAQLIIENQPSEDLKQIQSNELTATVTEIDPLRGQVTAKMAQSNWGQIKSDEESKWSWSFINPQDRDIADHFSFMISVALNRDKLPAGDIDATARWMETIISEEMPAYIVPCLHWMEQSVFDDFSLAYNRWQNGGQPLGDSSYRLLELLAMGQLKKSSEILGIGNMCIATQDQHDQAEKGGDQWDFGYISSNHLLYVPEEMEAHQANARKTHRPTKQTQQEPQKAKRAKETKAKK